MYKDIWVEVGAGGSNWDTEAMPDPDLLPHAAPRAEQRRDHKHYNWKSYKRTQEDIFMPWIWQWIPKAWETEDKTDRLNLSQAKTFWSSKDTIRGWQKNDQLQNEIKLQTACVERPAPRTCEGASQHQGRRGTGPQQKSPQRRHTNGPQTHKHTHSSMVSHQQIKTTKRYHACLPGQS